MSGLGDRPAASSGAATGSGQLDLAFAGAGAATSYVLLALLAQATDQPPADPLRIAVVEKDPQPFSGLPYGSRAARTCLLITTLRDFLPDGERREFTDWLRERKSTAFDAFRAAGGPYSTRWWERHREQIEQDDFDDLYLPRYLFGDYLGERVRGAIAAAESAGAASVTVVQDEVRSVTAIDSGYHLECAGRSLTARRLVLATGSAPALPRMPSQDSSGIVVVDGPFDHLDRALDRIRQGLARPAASHDPVVVIVGANASAMDVLYQVNDLGTPELDRTTFVVLSPRGELPARMDRVNASSSFQTRWLDELAQADVVDAEAVYTAAVQDIERGRAAGVPVDDTLQPVSRGVVRVLPRLSPRGALDFAGRWGAELGRHQRRAGSEYHEVVDHLRAAGRLRVVAGGFLGITAGPDGLPTVRYDVDGEVQHLRHPVDVVINCGGPARELEQAHDFLPARLIADRVCRPTPYGGGIAVDSSLQAAPGLFVMGPLLAGNVVDGFPIWHMEHCGRISAYGSMLGTALAGELLEAHPAVGTTVVEPLALVADDSVAQPSDDSEYQTLSPFG